MPIKPTEKIWRDGKFIRWDDAQVHVLSHVVSYGSALFEGIRCYKADRKSTRLNSSHIQKSRMPSSA